MGFKPTTALKKIIALKKRLKFIQGGTSAGKTIAVLLILIDRAQSRKNILSSVVSETLPHLRRGAIRDFLNIMQEQGYFKETCWNKTEFTYTFETGSKIEFFSADAPDKVRGPRRNGDLFLNECNNIPYETYVQLVIRTEGEIFCDFNPVSEFFYHEEILNKADHDFIVLTYKDNEGLPKVIVDEIESRRGNKMFWQVYGLGQLGEIEERIYTGWQFVDEVPREAELLRHWLDFGYTNDPTAIGDLYYLNGIYYLDEQAYRKGLSNKDIADILNNLKKALTVADSAEPKSIDELATYGVSVIPSPKGPGSVNQQISVVQGEAIAVTKRSVNLIKEYRNWTWMKDPKTGRIINEPIPLFDHHMKGIGYAMATLAPMLRRRELENIMPRLEQRARPNPAR